MTKKEVLKKATWAALEVITDIGIGALAVAIGIKMSKEEA